MTPKCHLFLPVAPHTTKPTGTNSQRSLANTLQHQDSETSTFAKVETAHIESTRGYFGSVLECFTPGLPWLLAFLLASLYTYSSSTRESLHVLDIAYSSATGKESARGLLSSNQYTCATAATADFLHFPSPKWPRVWLECAGPKSIRH